MGQAVVIETTNAPTYEDVLRAIDKAWDEVSALCSGKRRWTMRVPAEPDRDSDLVIGEALRLSRIFIEANPTQAVTRG